MLLSLIFAPEVDVASGEATVTVALPVFPQKAALGYGSRRQILLAVRIVSSAAPTMPKVGCAPWNCLPAKMDVSVSEPLYARLL